VRRFEQLGFPLERIDSTGFMVGKTAPFTTEGCTHGRVPFC